MAIKKLRMVADFETTTTPDDVRVWGGCAVDIDTFEVLTITNSISEFFDFLKDKNTEIFFHNLKFDGEYLISYLLNNGYTLSKEKREKTFDCLITDMGVFYSIEVIFEVHNKKYKKAVIYDSLKKLPFKVSQISEAFKLKDKKLEIDYDEYRPVGHILTEEERDYITNDCKIVAEALHVQMEKGLTRMTNASDAMSDFKNRIGKKVFEKLFPVFPYEMDKDIRRAYKGGYTILKEEHRNARGLKGVTVDYNSMYPGVMYDSLLPWGYPIFFEGEPTPDDKFPLFIVRMRTDFELKPGHLPTIQLKKQRWAKETEYLKNSKDERGEWVYPEMTVTNVDLEIIKEHYELIDPVYISGYKFKGITGIFREYIDHWMEIKATSTGAMRTLAKLMLNSLYGRFALNPDTVGKIPYLDNDGVVRYKTTDKKDDPYVKKYRDSHHGPRDIDRRDAVYTPMACFITAYARAKIIRAAQSVYDRFIYCDTDSLHLIGFELPALDLHPTRLGACKIEGQFLDSKYIRAKTYMETMFGTEKDSLKQYCKLLQKCDIVRREPNGIYWENTHVTCAGMPDNVKELVNYDNFETGAVFEGKLTPRRYPGGIILKPGPFTIH